jgi:hypothetical protein
MSPAGVWPTKETRQMELQPVRYRAGHLIQLQRSEGRLEKQFVNYDQKMVSKSQSIHTNHMLSASFTCIFPFSYPTLQNLCTYLA